MREPRSAPEYVHGQRPGDLYVRLPRPRRTLAPPPRTSVPRFWPLALWARWTRAAAKRDGATADGGPPRGGALGAR